MTDETRQWFVDHEDGNVEVLPLDHPYTVVLAPAKARCVLYTGIFGR